MKVLYCPYCDDWTPHHRPVTFVTVLCCCLNPVVGLIVHFCHRYCCLRCGEPVPPSKADKVLGKVLGWALLVFVCGFVLFLLLCWLASRCYPLPPSAAFLGDASALGSP